MLHELALLKIFIRQLLFSYFDNDKLRNESIY